LITDDAVPILSRMQSLIQLDVAETGMTRKALKELQAALPACKLFGDDGFSR
jgi:hypothetical protein